MFKSVTFEVIGEQRLHCEGCEQRVERLLKAVPGIRQVRARASNQRIEVLLDTAKVEPNAIAERIAKAGYQTNAVSSVIDSGS